MRADTRAVNMPSLPLGAQEEILDKLFTDMHISSDDIVKILKKYEVAQKKRPSGRFFCAQKMARYYFLPRPQKSERGLRTI